MIVSVERFNSCLKLANTCIETRGLNPLSGAVTFLEKGGVMYLITSNPVATLRLSSPIEVEEFDKGLNFSVDLSILTKLFAKSTGVAKMTIMDTKLVIECKGEYKIPIIYDYDNNNANNIDIKDIEGSSSTVNYGDLVTDFARVITCCGDVMTMPELCSICASDNIVATDGIKMLFKPNNSDFRAVIPVVVAKIIINVFTDDIQIKHENDDFILESTNKTLWFHGFPMDKYPTNIISTVNEYNTIDIDGKELSEALQRLMLFISDFDRNRVYIEFTDSGLALKTCSGDAHEFISYNSPYGGEVGLVAIVDIRDLTSVVKQFVDATIVLWVQQDGNAIGLRCGDLTGMVGLYDK